MQQALRGRNKGGNGRGFNVLQQPLARCHKESPASGHSIKHRCGPQNHHKTAERRQYTQTPFVNNSAHLGSSLLRSSGSRVKRGGLQQAQQLVCRCIRLGLLRLLRLLWLWRLLWRRCLLPVLLWSGLLRLRRLLLRLPRRKRWQLRRLLRLLRLLLHGRRRRAPRGWLAAGRVCKQLLLPAGQRAVGDAHARQAGQQARLAQLQQRVAHG